MLRVAPSAEAMARAALQGFFGTPEFRDMQHNAQRRRAVRRVQELLDAEQAHILPQK